MSFSLLNAPSRLSAVPRSARLFMSSLAAMAVPSLFLGSAQAQLVTVLPEIVVTATRSPSRIDELVSDVLVIDRKAIDASSARTPAELLARLAGVQTSATGGAGKASSIFIRGTEARHTVLLIDGVRYGSATVGSPAWENLPLDAIERIEVVKGPGSALYGSDAVGGVVQIFTRQGGKGFAASVGATVGSEGYKKVSANASGTAGQLDYALGVHSIRDGSFSATNASVPFGSFNADADPFNQLAFNGSVAWRLADGWKVSGSLMQSSGTNHADDGPGRDARSKLVTQSTGINLSGQPMAGWSSKFSWGQSADKNNAVVASTLPSRFETEQQQLGWQNNLASPLGTVLLGVDRLQQNVSSSTAYTVSGRTVNSLYAGLNGSAGSHAWQANLRRDSNSQFGSASTVFAGYGLQISPQWRARAAYGTSFVAPSFNQLYFPNFGNANLQPERGRNTELGLEANWGNHQLKLVRFDNRIRGFITATTVAANIPKARIDGWTLGYTGAFDALGVRASFDELNPTNELTGKVLPRRAKQQITLGGDYTTGPWRLGASWLSMGARFDNAANTTPLAAYATLDASADYALSRQWQVQTRLRNLTNKVYETALGYNQPGRGVFVGVKWQPK